MNAAAPIAPPAGSGLSTKTRALVALAAGHALRGPAAAEAQAAQARAAGATPLEIAEATGIAASFTATEPTLPLWEEG